MRATKVVLAAVLGSIVAGTGCCKTCDWCNWGTKSAEKPVQTVGSPPVVSTEAKAGAPSIPVAPPTQPVAPGGTGTYGGTGN